MGVIFQADEHNPVDISFLIAGQTFPKLFENVLSVKRQKSNLMTVTFINTRDGKIKDINYAGVIWESLRIHKSGQQKETSEIPALLEALV